MSTRIQVLDFREEGFSPSAEEKEASSVDPETTKKETKSPWCQHGGYVKKTTIKSQKAGLAISEKGNRKARTAVKQSGSRGDLS